MKALTDESDRPTKEARSESLVTSWAGRSANVWPKSAGEWRRPLVAHRSLAAYRGALVHLRRRRDGLAAARHDPIVSVHEQCVNRLTRSLLSLP